MRISEEEKKKEEVNRDEKKVGPVGRGERGGLARPFSTTAGDFSLSSPSPPRLSLFLLGAPRASATGLVRICAKRKRRRSKERRRWRRRRGRWWRSFLSISLLRIDRGTLKHRRYGCFFLLEQGAGELQV